MPPYILSLDETYSDSKPSKSGVCWTVAIRTHGREEEGRKESAEERRRRRRGKGELWEGRVGEDETHMEIEVAVAEADPPEAEPLVVAGAVAEDDIAD